MVKRKRPPRKGSGDPRRRAEVRDRRDDDLELLGQIREALGDDHPLTLLALASSMLSVSDPRRLDPFDQQEEVLPAPADLLAMFTDSGQPEALALAAAMAHLQPDELLRARTVRAIDDTRLPPWLRHLGQAAVTGALETVESLRDADDVVLGVRIGDQDLTVVALTDFNAGGSVKDGFAIPTSVSGFEDAWRRAGGATSARIVPLSPADARARLEPAIDSGARTWPRFESDSWPQARPLLEWAMRLCPPGGVGYDRPELSVAEQDRLLEDFLLSPHGRGMNDQQRRDLIEQLIIFGTGWTWGDPLLLSPTKIEILLLGWAPGKIMANAGQLARLPDVLRAFVRYGHERRDIAPSNTAETLSQIDALEPAYLELIRQPRRLGPEALLERMGLLDDEPDPSEWGLLRLAEQVGGPERLQALTDEPLPEEDLDLDGVPEDVVPRVLIVAALSDDCCAALFDDEEQPGHEHRTAVRRLLHDVAVGDPAIFRRRSKDEMTAAALCWLVGRANETFHSYGPPQVQQMMAHFGLKGSPSQRAEPMRRVAGVPREPWRTDLASTRYLVSSMRRRLIEQRDYFRSRQDEDRRGDAGTD